MNLRIQKPISKASFLWTPVKNVSHAKALGLDSKSRSGSKPLVHVKSVWLEAPLGDDWCIALQIAVQSGRPVVSELRVFPAERPPQLIHVDGSVRDFVPEAGQWTGKWLGVDATVPRGGLTSTIAKKARIPMYAGYLEEIRREALKEFKRDYFVERFGFPEVQRTVSPKSTSGKPTRGRPKLSDEALLPIANDYAAACAAGSRRPLQDLARKRGQGVEEIRRRVLQCRRRDLLTKAAPGAPGGKLTPMARRLLRQSGRKSRKARPSKTSSKNVR